MTVNTLGMQQPISTYNLDSGTKQMLTNALGKPIRLWDSLGNIIRTEYDVLARPIATYLTEKGFGEIKLQYTEYGTNKTNNSIGQPISVYDQSGLSQIISYDFKGNPLKTRRQFCEEYKGYRDWNNKIALEDKIFSTSYTYNALNHIISQVQPDGTLESFNFNKAGLLNSVNSAGIYHVTDINYNEKAQRIEIYYGNGSKTKYEYDAKSFRLTRLLTTRNSGRDILQDIHYIYDAAGNIVEQEDKAQQKHFFKNQEVEPKALYYYDALYRLVKAKGRELKNLGMPSASDIPDSIGLPNTAPDAMQNYTHQYKYDELGNILQHKSLGQWTRDYLYDFTRNNHLLGHTAGKTEYAYDAHGNMLKIPHLKEMHWDCSGNLISVDLDEAGNKAFYVYDSSGERVRKIVEKVNVIEERYYFGDYENYAKFVSDSQVCERTTLHISDDKSKIASIDKQTIKDGKAVEEPAAITRYQLDNHLGSACLELDEKAEMISYEEYHPFGTSSYRSARSETEVSQKRYKYCGKERDDESGLHYYGVRYYAAWLGRFISVDPLKEERSWLNPFNYCQCNPINRADPSGALDEGEDEENVANQDLNSYDHYFNSNGVYLGSDIHYRSSDGVQINKIKVIDQGLWDGIKTINEDGTESVDHEIASISSQNHSISGISTEASLNVYQHYNPTNLPVVENTRSSKSGMTFNRRNRVFKIKINGNRRNKFSDDINIIKNMYSHEVKHYNDFIMFGNRVYSAMTIQTRERRAFSAQMKDPSWKNVNIKFKNSVMNKAEEYGVMLPSEIKRLPFVGVEI